MFDRTTAFIKCRKCGNRSYFNNKLKGFVCKTCGNSSELGVEEYTDAYVENPDKSLRVVTFWRSK